MGKIVLLDDLTINQIAAGEVIERPASVVKELVENSIDAGAKNVTVEIKNGGISYIRVTDDGSGIMPDDMEIAFERHATSKIRKADDLNVVKSMGFRGEALASISAISKMELVSKTYKEKIGYKIIAEGGNIVDKHEEGAQKGTTITVKELFYNTPVRYKFLKKDFTESGYIEDTVTRIALANPNVAIKLVNTGKKVIQTNGNGKIEDCIYEIFGREVFDNILPVDYIYENYHVTGVIGKPIISRSNRTNQIFFVNKRYVRNKTLSSAAEQGFKGLVTIGKHGFLILNIDMNPGKVDVNVHPTKLEIRFQEESKVFKAVYHSIKETLLKSDLVSDPVKDYDDVTPNDILKGISNKQRVQAWDIQNSKEKKSEKPKFTEFKDTISGLDSETRRKFIDEITGAKTPDDIIKGAVKYTNLAKGGSILKEDNEKYELENKKNELKSKEIDEEEKTNVEVEQDNNIKAEEIDSKSKAKFFTVKDETIKDTNFIVNKENDKESNKTEETTSIDSNLDEKELNKIEDKEEKKDHLNDKKDKKNKKRLESEDEIIEKNEERSEEQVPELVEEKLSFEEMYKKLFGRDIQTAKKEFDQKVKIEEQNSPIHSIKDNEISLFDIEGVEKTPVYQFIGIAFNTYIILTMNDEMYLMDQHAAHERIMYEKVKKNYFNEGEKDCQMMLLPDVVNLSNKEMGVFRDNKELFLKAGFEVEEFGDNTVKITGVPEFCLDFNNKEIFLETLDEIDTVARTARQELEDKFLATVACKAAVKAHMALSKDEVDSLMKQLLKLPNPFSCPHGRPTVIKMTKKDIEKKFSRT
ncbi:MAG: DNA mismatch repair endonuclease MutL [Clostridia bacterium]|nr:DNA mismatch repair endonuclease MutL [Clostridia bacterium]